MKMVTLILFCTFLIVTGAKVFNSSQLDGKIQNGRISTTSVKKAVVFIKRHGEYLCSGCYISSDYFITSYMCSRQFYTTYNYPQINYRHISDGLLAYADNVGREIQEAFRLHKEMDNFLLFDIALAKVVHSYDHNHPVTHIKLSHENIVRGLGFQIYGWDNVRGPRVSSEVTVADVEAMDFFDCRFPFNPTVLDININKCARTKNDARISLLDAGSPMVIGNELAGVVTHILGISGEFILFVPSASIRRFWYMSPHANILERIEGNDSG